MKIRVRKIGNQLEEVVEVQCHEITEEVREIVRFVKSRQGQLTASFDGRQYEIAVMDIYYIEVVDSKSFIYCSKEVYETKEKLYALESELEDKSFLRVSKSTLLNLMKVTAIKPGFNGRFIAVLQNGEEVIISRKYVPALREKLAGGKK